MADSRERLPLWVVFSGMVLVGIGSAYYHYAPSNETLLWDRLPIALVFMAIVAMIICERLDVKVGVLLLGPLLLLGGVSVVYWQATELAGQGRPPPLRICPVLPGFVHSPTDNFISAALHGNWLSVPDAGAVCGGQTVRVSRPANI